jgi:hypothetical protein
VRTLHGVLKGVSRSLDEAGAASVHRGTSPIKGVYRVVAGASTASIDRGTFTVQDRCDGTLTKITKGHCQP